MKQTIFLTAVFSVLFFTSCTKNTIRGEGPIVTETRDLAAFSEVEADGDLEVAVYPSNTNRAEITGYHNLIPVFETEVRNGKLRLKYEDRYFNVRHNNIKVTLYTTDMSSYSINGSGKTRIHTGFNALKMDLEINGSGDIDIDENHFTDMYCKINGSGNINGRYCETDNARLRISGSGNMELTVLETLDVQISGSGDITYWGSPRIVNSDISGSGKVRKKG